MFKRILLAVLLTISYNQFCGAMQSSTMPLEKCIVTMPNEATLKGLFSVFGMDYFVEKTNVIRQLAGRELFPDGIERAKQLLLADYSETFKGMPRFMSNRLVVQAAMGFDAIIDKVLQDFPGAREQLQRFRDEIKK